MGALKGQRIGFQDKTEGFIMVKTLAFEYMAPFSKAEYNRSELSSIREAVSPFCTPHGRKDRRLQGTRDLCTTSVRILSHFGPHRR